MYEKKNKLNQSAPILDKKSVRLSDVVYHNINIYFLEYALATSPLEYCFLVLKYITIVHL